MNGMGIERRPVGRPRGQRDMRGKARRVDPSQDRTYRVAIARRLHDARVEQDISPKELAAAAGVDESCVYRIERAERRVLALTLCRLAVALGLSPSELMP